MSSLKHWVREVSSSFLDPLGPLVPESLAFPDKQKLVLVETNRLEATLACVDAVKKLGVREVILYFDWRVLEDWQVVEGQEDVDESDNTGREVLEKRYFGSTCWSEERREVVFMHRDLVRMPQAWIEY